ncbi:hypothetical protein HCH52_03245 [Oscillospiraceae bacterium HV4-5-C5C]|nr:hypothetical protein [Oscillospiraceae bacterium HV4-5-C5C]
MAGDGTVSQVHRQKSLTSKQITDVLSQDQANLKLLQRTPASTRMQMFPEIRRDPG